MKLKIILNLKRKKPIVDSELQVDEVLDAYAKLSQAFLNACSSRDEGEISPDNMKELLAVRFLMKNLKKILSPRRNTDYKRRMLEKIEKWDVELVDIESAIVSGNISISSKDEE